MLIQKRGGEKEKLVSKTNYGPFVHRNQANYFLL